MSGSHSNRAKAKDSIKSKDDLLTKATAKKREHRGSARISIIKSSLAFGLWTNTQ